VEEQVPQVNLNNVWCDQHIVTFSYNELYNNEEKKAHDDDEAHDNRKGRIEECGGIGPLRNEVKGGLSMSDAC